MRMSVPGQARSAWTIGDNSSIGADVLVQEVGAKVQVSLEVGGQDILAIDVSGVNHLRHFILAGIIFLNSKQVVNHDTGPEKGSIQNKVFKS